MIGISGYETSIPRYVVAAALVVARASSGSWSTSTSPRTPRLRQGARAAKKPDEPAPAGWPTSSGWNFLIGFGLIFLGLIVSAHKTTPLGRGRGVVIGMLGCFLIGLVWIVVFYFVGQRHLDPGDARPGQYNLLVGIGFMAVGFTFATKWE